MDWAAVATPLTVMGAVALALGILLWFRPEKFARVRINLVWVSTLVAILTLTFGMELIGLLRERGEGGGANTLESEP